MTVAALVLAATAIGLMFLVADWWAGRYLTRLHNQTLPRQSWLSVIRDDTDHSSRETPYDWADDEPRPPRRCRR